MLNAFRNCYIYGEIFCTASYWTYTYNLHVNMDPIHYWLVARKYSVWNAAVAALQFWTADLEAHMLGSAIKQVYNAFFYSTSMHLLHQQPDEVLFGQFVTTLNATFESKLSLEDEGYESGSENFNIPNPLRRGSKIYHVSSVEHASFDPNPVTPCSTSIRESHSRPVCRHLTYSSSEDDDDTTREDPISWQYLTSTIPHKHFSAAILPVCHPRHRRRRGLTNSTTRWWTLGNGGDSQ